MQTTMMQKYTRYITEQKAAGREFLALQCPSCKGTIETEQPPAGAEWDSLSICPHCEKLFFKTVIHGQACGAIPPFKSAPLRSPPSLLTLRRRAKKIKRATGCKHTEALQALAQTYGFKSWTELVREHPEPF